MARTRKTFGPLLYGTLAVSLAALLVVESWRTLTRWDSEARAAQWKPDAAVAELIPRVTAGGGEARAEAVRGLGTILNRYALGDRTRHHGEGVRALRGALRDEEATVRAAAAGALGELYEPARSAAGDLSAALDDPDQDVRFAAAKALLRADPGQTDRALRVLAEAVAGATATDLPAALAAMRDAGERGEAAAVKVIVAMLSDEDEGARLAVLDCVTNLSPAPPTLATALGPLLASDKPGLRATAALVVMQGVDPEKEPDLRVIAALEAAAVDTSASPGLRERALGGLYSVAPKFGAAALRRCGRGLARQLDHKVLKVRLDAATLLHLIDPETLAGKNDPAENPGAP